MIRLNSLADWENLIEKSKDIPVVILKHSNACPVSASAFKRVSDAVQKGALLNPVYFVVIQEHRDISNQIEVDTDVKHESPQIIIIRSGHSVYHASHNAIDPEKIAAALERNK